MLISIPLYTANRLQIGYKNEGIMAKVKLTAGRIKNFKCDEGKVQAFLWCNEVPGLGVRATPTSTAKGYIYQAKVKGQSMRVTIGKVGVWSIAEAKPKPAAYKS